MSKYLVVENEETGDWEIWSDDDDDQGNGDVVLMATVYDEDFADDVVKLLNDNEDEYVHELEPDEDFGEAVDEFIKNDHGRTAWDERDDN